MSDHPIIVVLSWNAYADTDNRQITMQPLSNRWILIMVIHAAVVYAVLDINTECHIPRHMYSPSTIHPKHSCNVFVYFPVIRTRNSIPFPNTITSFSMHEQETHRCRKPTHSIHPSLFPTVNKRKLIPAIILKKTVNNAQTECLLSQWSTMRICKGQRRAVHP